MTVHRINGEELDKGEAKFPWLPPVAHPTVPPEFRKELAEKVLPQFLAVPRREENDIKPVWNELLPDMKFTDVETFLRSAIQK